MFYNCGNSTVETQTLTVEDTEAPILSGIPADATVACGSIPAPATPTATDVCDTNVEINFSEISEPGTCVDSYILIRTWTAIDNCGNTATASQTLIVEDTEAPVLSGIPADATATCNTLPAPANPVATDNCDTEVEIDYSETEQAGTCTDSYVLVRTWIATDNCGNTTTESQSITIEDTTAPTLTGIPGDLTVSCGTIIPVAIPLAMDNCDTDVEIEFTESEEPGDCSDNYTLLRSWTAVDNCGNSTTQTQTITVEDTEDPTLTGVPADVSVDCDEIPIIPDINTDILATDNCDAEVEITFTENTIASNCAATYQLIRTWKAIDNCGNETTASQIISVGDNEAPVISNVPADLTVSCGAIPPVASPDVVDSCDDDVDLSYTEIRSDGVCEEEYTLSRIWTATDNCGNSGTATQTITVVDNENPSLFGVPADMTADCDNVPSAPDLSTLIATDNCDTAVEIVFGESASPGSCADAYELIRTWTAIDNCGNETSMQQVITVVDTEAPSLLGVPADLTIDLGNGEVLPDPADVLATDNCDTNVEVSLSESSQTSGCVTVLTRTWVAVDNCDNVTSESQQITIAAALVPSISPANAVICAGGTVTFNGSPVDPDFNYSWTATGGVFNDPTSVNPEYTMMTPGTYTIELQINDNGGCSGTATATVTVLEEPTAVASSNSPVCEGDPISLFAEGGSVYIWTGPNGFSSNQQNPVINNASPANSGTYTVTVLLGDCSAQASVEVVVNEELLVDFNAGNQDCTNLGFINIGVYGGTGNYTYDWLDLPGTDDPEDRNDLMAGTYSATITDAGGCSFVIDAIIIEDLSEGVADATLINTTPDQCGLCNGSASLAPANYTFAWNDGGSGAQRSDLCAGIYTVTATSPEGCTSIVTVEIDEACACQPPVVENITVVEASCGNADGAISIVLGGNAADYAFAWSPAVSATAEANNLSAGTYNVTITDITSVNCFIVQTVVVGNSDGPTPTQLDVTPAFCAQDNGSAFFAPTTYGYQWSDGGTGFGRVDLFAGTYQVTITDPATTCTNVVAVEVPVLNTLNGEAIIANQPDCNSQNGVVSIQASGGSADYAYEWSDGGNGQTRNDLGAGAYEVTVSDNGLAFCTTVVSFVLTNQIDAGATVNLVTDTISTSCAGISDATLSYDIIYEADFVQPATVVILDSDGNIQDNGAIGEGEYCLLVSDAEGCLAAQACFVVVEPSLITLGIQTNPADCTQGGSIEIVANGGSGTYHYFWDDLPGSDDLAIRTNLTAGTYNLTVTDASGCSAVANNLVILDDCLDCPEPATVQITMPVEESETYCVLLESCYDPQETTYEVFGSNNTSGSTNYGDWTLNDACLVYTAYGTPGQAVDTVGVIAYYDGLADTTWIIVSITEAPLSEPALDTIYLSTTEESSVDTCLSLTELNGNFASNTIWYQPLNGSGNLQVDDDEACLSYTPGPGHTGNFIDTMGVIVCDDLLVCDTTVIIVSVIPNSCDSIFPDSALTIMVDECFEFGTYCLDINPVNLFDYAIFDNGQVYNGGFVACNFDTMFSYATNVILMQAPLGPYILEAWTVNGTAFSTPSFLDLEELVDSMNVWDPAGNWQLLPSGEIQGGSSTNVYGALEIRQIPFPFSNFTIPLGSVEIPNGFQIAVDTGYHEIIINELATGCQDTLDLTVSCDLMPCPQIYSGPDSLTALSCDTTAQLCLEIPIPDLLNYTIIDNGQFYTDDLLGCAFDSLITYLAIGFNTGDEFALDSWTINGNVFSLSSFNSVAELVDSMNIWDPAANWELQGILIVGGDYANVYGDIVVSQNGSVAATANPNLQVVPNGVSIALEIGNHEVIVTDTTNGCSETILVSVGCPMIGGSSIDTLITLLETETDTFCLDLSTLDTITSITNLCPGDSDGNIDFDFIAGTSCVEFTGVTFGQDTICLEVCDSTLQICDTANIIVDVIPVIDTIEITMLLGFSDTICVDTALMATELSIFFNYCDPLDGPNIDYLLEDNCVEITGIETGLDTLCLVACDMVGNCDTTVIITEVLPQSPDIFVTTITVGLEPDTICLDTTELAGTIVSITNECEEASGTFVDFDILDDYCISFVGLLPEGSDTACFVFCDEFDICDTAILVVNTIENTAIDPPIAVDDDTTGLAGNETTIQVLENDTLRSTLLDVNIVTPPGNGNVVINPDFSITYLPDPDFCGALDSFVYSITTLGGTDEATVVIDVYCQELTIFSGMSPNGDGVNDTFTILGIENFPNNRVCVFNRWGNRVYEQKGYRNETGWDGSWSGKSLPDGTYFYLVEVEDENGETMKFNGYLQIQR